MRAIKGAVACAAVLLSVLSAGAVAAEAVPRKLFSLADSRLDEASGLGVGIRSAGVLYAQNDSGDAARFFALDARTGQTLAVCAVPGVGNVDWEDLAVAPDRRGVVSVWLADIGDNDARRSMSEIYRVDEPLIAAGRARGAVTTSSADVWRLRYPGGARDAESMAVDPVSHRIYLFTKSLDGETEVFLVPPDPAPDRVQSLSRIGSIRFGLTGTPGGPNIIGELTATGATMSIDGSILALRTYTDAYFWHVSGGNLAAALKAAPIRLPLPEQPQGEGIAIRANAALIDSEKTGSPVFEVPLPSGLQAGPAAPSAAASIGGSSAGKGRPGAAAAAKSGPAKSPIAGTGGSGILGNRLMTIGAVGLGAVLVLGLCWLMLAGAGRRTRR